MLTRALHCIAKNPWVYEQIQILAGAKYVRRRLAMHIASLKANLVLDVGGGTGFYREVLSPDCHYVCLDIDITKLHGFRRRHLKDAALCGDAAQIPIETNSVDAVMCIAVAHHLTDKLLEQMLNESVRVLRGEGTFIFLDPVWEPSSLVRRLLWRYDRGSHPRTAAYLRSAISNHYSLIRVEQFSIYHEYFLCVGSKHLTSSKS